MVDEQGEAKGLSNREVGSLVNGGIEGWHSPSVVARLERSKTTLANTYDANGNLKTSQDPFGNLTTYGYFATGQLQTVLAPGNTVATTFAYNADGTTKTITDPTSAVTTLGYDGAGHLTSLKDPGNHTRSMTVDNLGHVLTMTDALTNKTTFTYDAEGNRKTLKDPTNATRTFAYDALNRLTTTTDALSHISKTAYDPEGHVLSRTDANGATTTYSYDKSGRMLSTTDALGNLSSQGYCADLAGSPCQRVDPDGNLTTTQFDSLGRAISVTDGSGATTQTQYQSGLVSRVTDARGNQTNYNYNSLSTQLQSVNNPLNSTSYTYDARGNRATVVSSGTTTYTHDANNRLLTEKNPLNVTTTYTYNLDGTRATKTDGNNHQTTYGYDANKRLTSVTFADATTYGFTYDSRGHRLTETSPSVTRTMTYDTLGRLATAQDGLTTKTITYGYDAVGNRSSITYDGLKTAYDYDADHRLTSLADSTGEVTGIAHDPAGNRATLAQGNGVATHSTYDADNRVAKIASPIQSFAYLYDLAGNPYQKTFADGTNEQYAYDGANELTNVTQRNGGTLGYNYYNGTIQQWLVNGAATETDSPNTFNQITRLSGTDANTYTFDSNGNRLTQSIQLPGFPAPPVQNTTYTWNDDDRMSGVTLPSSATNTYGYDANGIRVSKKDSSGNVNYLIDPQTQSILATYDATMGTRLAVYNQNPQKIDEVLSYQVNALKYYPHTDMLGSVYAVSDSTAKAIATWTYDVWGTRTQASGTLSYPFGFTGRDHDPDTGLIYARQRYYDPGIGSWLAPDRLGMPEGPNRSAYVTDRPSLEKDPRGQIGDVDFDIPDAPKIFIAATLLDVDLGLSSLLLGTPCPTYMPEWVQLLPRLEDLANSDGVDIVYDGNALARHGAPVYAGSDGSGQSFIAVDPSAGHTRITTTAGGLLWQMPSGVLPSGQSVQVKSWFGVLAHELVHKTGLSFSGDESVANKVAVWLESQDSAAAEVTAWLQDSYVVNL